MTVVRDDASLIGEGYLKESHLKQHLCCYFDLTKFNLGKQDGVDVVFLCAFTIFHVPLTGMARNTWAAPSCNPQFRFQTQLRSAHMLMSWWNTLKSSMSYYVILCPLCPWLHAAVLNRTNLLLFIRRDDTLNDATEDGRPRAAERQWEFHSTKRTWKK